MAAATPLSLDDLRTRFRLREAPKVENEKSESLSLDWPDLDAALPDHGLPRGVVELSAPHALGSATSIALAAVRAAQARDARSHAAWIDPDGTLYAPGVVRRGVDLARLFVVRPSREDLSRIAVKVLEARAFDVVVIDMDVLAGVVALPSPASRIEPRRPRPIRPSRPSRRGWPSEVLVRKLALLAEESGSTVLLVTNARAPRLQPWPVALRLELTRARACTYVRVAKERYGRMSTTRLAVRPPSRWRACTV